MKLRYYFALIVIITILFSLGSVVACENSTVNASATLNEFTIESNSVDENLNEISENHESSTNDPSSSNDLIKNNLTVYILVRSEDNNINKTYWTLTPQLSGGIAYNTKIHFIFSVNQEYVSHNISMGTYNSLNKIWNIGNLTSLDKPSLTLLTELKNLEQSTTSFNVLTDSKDVDVFLNFTLKPTGTNSSYHENSDNRNRVQHNDHPGSIPSGSHSVTIIIENQTSSDSTDVVSETGENTDSDEKTKTESNSNTPTDNAANRNSNKDSDHGDKSNSITKTILSNKNLESLTKSLSRTYDSITNSIAKIFNPTSLFSDDTNSSSSNSPINAILAYDYTRIPILIFATFLILLVCIVGIGKIKK